MLEIVRVYLLFILIKGGCRAEKRRVLAFEFANHRRGRNRNSYGSFKVKMDNYGLKTMEFEKQFADFVGVKYAVALTSGTAGMHLLLHSLGLSPTDEILTPALTFASTINQIVLNGAKPIFVDVEYDTMLMDIEDLKRKVTKNTKAVIPVHFAG